MALRRESKEHMMFNVPVGQDDHVLEIKGSHLRAAQAKWDRLTVSDYSRIKNVRQLIAIVEERYSLPHEHAKNDVEIWVKNM